MILLAAAARSSEICDILELFRSQIPTDRRAIDSTINNLRDLIPVLRELARDIESRDGVVSRVFADDLELLQHSVAYTLQDIWTILGRMPSQRISHDYHDAWKEILAHNRATRPQSLPMRIETYSLFAATLRRQLRGYHDSVPSTFPHQLSYSEPPSRRTRIEDLRQDIKSLRRAQLGNRRLITAAEAINDLTKLPVPQLLPAPTSGSEFW